MQNGRMMVVIRGVALGLLAMLIVGCAPWPLGKYEVMPPNGKPIVFELQPHPEKYPLLGHIGVVTGDFHGGWDFLTEDRQQVGVYAGIGSVTWLRYTITRTDGRLEVEAADGAAGLRIRKIN